MKRPDPLIIQYRDRRHLRGMKPYILAELAGVWPQGVYDAEAGKRDLRLSTLRALADALDCDLHLVPRSRSATQNVHSGTTTEGTPA